MRQHHSRSSKFLRIATAAARLLLLTAAAACRDAAQRLPPNGRATHSNTATQQRTLTTSTLPPTRSGLACTQASKHTAPQLHTPIHCALNVLVTTTVTHNGGAALHARPRVQAAASSAATPHTQHCRSRCRLLHDTSSTLQLHHARSQDTCRTSAQHGLPATAAVTNNTCATRHRSPAATRWQRTRARSAARRTNMSDQPQTQSHAALRSHTAAIARRGAATHTRQHKSAIAILRYSTVVTALATAPAMHAQGAHRASRV
jgi:hypothetical protein